MAWSLVAPELIVVGTGLGVLLVDLFLTGVRRRVVGYLSLAGLLAALGVAARLLPVARAAGGAAGGAGALAGLFGGTLSLDVFAVVFKLLFLAVGALIVMLSVDFVERRRLPVGEFFALLLFAVLGMMLMASSRDLILIYLGLETSSIASYVLAGLLRDDPRSGEAAVKYFLTGALASAVILFGMSLIFGGTGSTRLADLPSLTHVPAVVSASRLPLVGLVLLVAGFGFKVAAVPFHFWAPDAYEGAPTPVTAFFSVGPKAAAFAAVLRIFAPVMGGPAMVTAPGGGAAAAVVSWATNPPLAALPVVFAVLAVVTMTVGNLTALAQKNIKRMLAYSSIAHAGYILVGLAVATPRGFGAMVYYLLAYAAMNVGAFAVVIWLNNRGTGDDVADYVGLGRRAPWAAIAMAVCFLSLIGIPPTAGFFGKLYLFLAAVEARKTWLAVVMVINSAISVGYYYGVVRNMYLQPRAPGEEAAQPGEAPVRGTLLVQLGLGLAVLAVFVLGFFFEPLARLAGLAGVGL